MTWKKFVVIPWIANFVALGLAKLFRLDWQQFLILVALLTIGLALFWPRGYRSD